MKILIKFLFLTTCSLVIVAQVEAQDQIAYSRLTDGYWQVWVMDADGGNQQQITDSKVDKRDPTWVNGISQIAYRTNNGFLYLVDKKNGTEKRLLEKYGIINNPDFSLNKDELVFVRFDPQGKDVSDIWLSDQNGNHSRIFELLVLNYWYQNSRT